MPFIGNKPSAVPLTSADIADGIITSAKIADGTIVNADINASAAIDSTKLSGVANTPAFFGYLGTSDQTVSDDTYTKVQINNEVFDSNSNFDSSTNYRFTPTTSGKYFVFGQIEGIQNNLFNTSVAIYKNGSIHISLRENPYSNAGSESGVYISGIVSMNGSTDYVELYGRVDLSSGTPKFAGSADTISEGYMTYFGAYKLIGA